MIFDCDGVIVDSEGVASRIVCESLTRYGWPMDAQQSNPWFVGGTMYKIEEAARARGVPLPEDWVSQTYQELFVALADTPPIDGVGDVLDLLDRRRLPYCIGSNGPQEKMDVTLRSAGFLARFDGRRFSAREVAEPKPAPDLFLYAAERMGAAPASCVVVGDTVNDAMAARAAGMRCFGYARDTAAERFLELDATPFAAMATLPGLLGLVAE